MAPVPAAVAVPPRAVEASDLGHAVTVLGRTHRPLGQVMTLVGVAVEGPWKGYEVGPNLVVQRIDGVATQEYIRIPIAGSTFDEPDPKDPRDRPFQMVRGQTYLCYGCETGGFVGNPPGTAPNSVQQTEYLFQCSFVMNWDIKPKAVAPTTFAPGDFLDRPALLAGTAINTDHGGYLVGPSWRCMPSDGGGEWPDWMVGKAAEVEGTVRAGPVPGEFWAEHATRRLVRLEDQVGHPVVLHGRAVTIENEVSFDYRGQRVNVADMDHLPGWSDDLLWKPILLRGELIRSGTKDGAQQYELRDASWSPGPPLRSVEQSLADNGVRD